MNKQIMKKIEKELKKENSICIIYRPTLEECDYLYSKGISVTKQNVSMPSMFLINHFTIYDFYTYTK